MLMTAITGRYELHTIRVLLVDDYQTVLEGLQRMLATDETIEVVGIARNGEEAINKAMALSPDVITMDIRMNGMDGIDTTRRLKAKIPNVNVLALTMYGESTIREAIDAGVSGYILKDSDYNQIIEAIHQVSSGGYPITPSLTRQRALQYAAL
jgi:DNA-binding NarL/FixJ family response regulator